MVSTGAGASASLSDAALEFAEIGVRARRVGAGMEFTRLGSVKGSSSYHIVKTAEDERESALLFLVQVRAVALGLVSIDVVGGAGVAWHRESVTVTPQPICCFPTPPSITSIDRARTGALVMGADVPLRLARILSIVPRARFYNVTRVTTAVLARTSMRSGVGVSVRVMW